MRYNLKRICKKVLTFALAVPIILGALTADSFAFEGVAGISAQEENFLFLDATVSDGGSCVEVVVSSSHRACGILVTLSYDSERFSFITFAKSDTLIDQATVSCFDSNGSLRMLIDADENFDGGVWCRLFFSIKEIGRNEPVTSDLCFEMNASVASAYELSEVGYSSLCFEDTSARLDLHAYVDRAPANYEENETVSVRRLDFGAAFEKNCALCISGDADREALAAGFEITVSCENLTESYTLSHVLPITADDKQGHTVIMLLPFRDSFYVTVRAIGYSARDIVQKDEIYCFFVSDSGIERVGLDR